MLLMMVSKANDEMLMMKCKKKKVFDQWAHLRVTEVYAMKCLCITALILY